MSEFAKRVETLNELLSILAEETSHATALICTDRQLSYGELVARVARVAAGLGATASVRATRWRSGCPICQPGWNWSSHSPGWAPSR